MKKILIVEDELPYLNLLYNILTKNGYLTIEVKDGNEGLAVAKRERPDLILLDIRMPVLGGLEMLKKLRQDEYGKTAKVIILTNLEPDDEIVQQVLETKPSYYLVKSDIKLTELVEKITVLLAEPSH